MERQIQVLVFTADVRVQVPPRPPKKRHANACLFFLRFHDQMSATEKFDSARTYSGEHMDCDRGGAVPMCRDILLVIFLKKLFYEKC